MCSFIASSKEVARNGNASISKSGLSLPSAEISRSPIGACPVRMARKISPPLNSEPPGWVTISILPPLFLFTIFANFAAFLE